MARWVRNRLQVCDGAHVVCPLCSELTNWPSGTHKRTKQKRQRVHLWAQKQNDSAARERLCFSAARSWRKPRNGATPVPGPTMIIGTCGLSGGRNGIVGLPTKPYTVAS